MQICTLEVRPMTDLTIVDTVGSAGEAALDTVVGGAALALDTVTRPRRSAGRARRHGNDVTEVIADVTEDVVDEVSLLPERVLVAYVRMLRRRARRDDVVGTVSRGVLGVLHRPAKDWARFFNRLERETTVERRARRASTGTGGARRKTTTGTRRTTATASRSTTRGSVRGTATRAARKATTGARRTTRTARGNAPTGGRATRRRSA
jgi:hypothetical protein